MHLGRKTTGCVCGVFFDRDNNMFAVFSQIGKWVAAV